MTKGRPWTRDLSEFDPSVNPDVWDLSDPDGGRCYERAKRLGIDKCILLPMDFHLLGMNRYHKTPESFKVKLTIEETNKCVADVAAKYSDRYIAFVSVDPRRDVEGLRLVKKAVQEWGAKGLKLHPSSGWFPNERQYYPLYELCMELDLPILTHCGPESALMPGKYGDPACWEDVLSDFPELRVCLAHGGGAFAHLPGRHLLDPAIVLLINYENAVVDLASGSRLYVTDPIHFYRELRRLLDFVGGKVLWGTDTPYMESRGMSWEKYLDVFTNPDAEILEKA